MSILDAAEMDLLREQSAAKPTGKGVQQVRLVGQDHRLRSALALLTRAQSMSQELMERSFVKLRQLPQRVEIAPVEIAPPKTIARMVRDGAAVIILDPHGGGEQAYLIIEAPLCFELTDRSFGGDGTATAEDLKNITPLMRSHAGELASGIVHMLDEAHGELWPALRVKGPATRIDLVLHALSEREAVVMRWLITEPLTTVALILPASLLNLPQRVAVRANDAQAQQRLAEHVALVELELEVELGCTVMSMAKLVGMQVGDVLRLDRGTAEALLVKCETKPLFAAKPSAVGEHVGLVFEHWLCL